MILFEKNQKIKADTKIFKINEIDNFIEFLNKYSSNSTIILATSSDIGKPGPLIDKLIYEKITPLLCPLVVINGNLQDEEIENNLTEKRSLKKPVQVCKRPFNWRKKWEKYGMMLNIAQRNVDGQNQKIQDKK